MTYFFSSWIKSFRIFKKMPSLLFKDINDFTFSECKLKELPIEKLKENYVRRCIKGVVFSHVDPTPLSNPRLVSYSEDALVSILDIDPVAAKSQDFVDFVAGNKILRTSTPLAHRYGGDQFGSWASQLGDGRAILLGQYVNRKNESWELQLKGSGKTPYSRDGDGRAVLRSSIREYLCSEAMHYLGIPTSRAAALIVSDDYVVRDLLYDGHPNSEPASVVLRLAPSWFRFGSLQILSELKEYKLLSELVDFIIKNYFPMIDDDENKVINFFKRVCRLTTDLTVDWQTVGFTHGVLNTDNISLNGITIDYGPFGFMEDYNYMYIPNHSDHSGRYSYRNQIHITMYNITKLAHTLSNLMNEEQLINLRTAILDEDDYMQKKIEEKFAKKLGLDKSTELVDIWLKMLNETNADFTMTFRELSENPMKKLINPSEDMWALSQLSKHDFYTKFIDMYCEIFESTGKSDKDRMKEMSLINPCYTLRNWMAEEAIKAAHSEDFSEVERLLRVLKQPFTRQEEAEEKGYASKPPVWSKTLCLSCSS